MVERRGVGTNGFIGLSTETKPSSPPNYPIDVGNTFFEKDTGKLFIYNGTSWVAINP